MLTKRSVDLGFGDLWLARGGESPRLRRLRRLLASVPRQPRLRVVNGDPEVSPGADRCSTERPGLTVIDGGVKDEPIVRLHRPGPPDFPGAA